MRSAIIVMCLAVAMLVAQPLTAAGTVDGNAEAINADVIRIGDTRVVLWGIDAPDPGQPCLLNGRPWGCFDAAMRALQIALSRGPVTCLLTDHSDPFGRSYGVCEIGGDDIGAGLVLAGLALAYPDETEAYLPMQQEAEAAGLGLWQPGVSFQPPWEWREIESPGSFK